MTILVDTSIWIDHFRRENGVLSALLNGALVLVHPFIIGEIALGSLRRRDTVLEYLVNLPPAVAASDDEVLSFINSEKLSGSGAGYLDTHLLVSAALSHAKLWTRDKKLAGIAAKVGLEFFPE